MIESPNGTTFTFSHISLPEGLKELQTQREHYRIHIKNALFQPRLFFNTLSGYHSANRLSDLQDALIGTMYIHLGGALLPPNQLFALGGFGRRELCPHSDIDVMLLVQKETPELEEFAMALYENLTQLGEKLSLAVRTLDETRELALSDLSIATSILTSRPLAGSNLCPSLAHFFTSSIEQTHKKEFLAHIYEGYAQRRHRFKDSIYLLEPNIKSGRGGLRSAAGLFWAAQIQLDTTNSRIPLIDKFSKFLPSKQYQKFKYALSYLLALRQLLHFQSNWRNDRLTFDLQEFIAHRFLMPQKDQLSNPEKPVEVLMKSYYRAAQCIESFATLWIQNWLDEDAQTSPLPAPAPPGFGLKSGKLIVAQRGSEYLKRKPLLPFKMALELKIPIHPQTIQRFQEEEESTDSGESHDPSRWKDLLKILIADQDPHRVLFAMAKAGVFFEAIPEFKALRGKIQHDLYHIYTTDTHLLYAFYRTRDLIQGTLAKEAPYMTALAGKTKNLHLLLLAALLHDIGKGKGRRHSHRGAHMVVRIGNRLGLSPEENKTLEILVRHHLLLPLLSQRRDINHPDTIHRAAVRCRTQNILSLLTLLSFIDGSTVGPGAYNDWKAYLLITFSQNISQYLESGLDPIWHDHSHRLEILRDHVMELTQTHKDLDPRKITDFFSDFPTRFLTGNSPKSLQRLFMAYHRSKESDVNVFHKHFSEEAITEVILITKDVLGVFAKVTAVFASMGLNIIRAQLSSDSNRTALDVFSLQDINTQSTISDYRMEKLHQKMIFALSGQSDPAKLLEGSVSQSLFPNPHLPGVKTRVTFENNSSARFTIIDVITLDEPGLLTRLGELFFTNQIDLVLAIINTEGNKVLDSFYVMDSEGKKLEERRAKVLCGLIYKILRP